MNKRIQEIAREAGFYANPDIEKFEKFAEIIVQECIGVVGKRFMGDLNREDMEVRRCVEDLKKHFGVEE